MIKRFVAIFLIFCMTSLAWLILGNTVDYRTNTQDSTLRSNVGELWGESQNQFALQAYYLTYENVIEQEKSADSTKTVTKTITHTNNLILDSSNINVDINLEPRKKGLLWYETYTAKFNADYRVVNTTQAAQEVFVDYQFPTQSGVYDSFILKVGQNEIQNIAMQNGITTTSFHLQPGQSENVYIQYQTNGLDNWKYSFAQDVAQVKNFNLNMVTNFKKIDFPSNCMSPSEKVETDQGWNLSWSYVNVLTGENIGLSMPEELNPGPWVADISSFAPVSLFLFFFMITMFAIMRKINIHPMNYFFIAAAFFSFHLLLAYLVDHILIHAAFIIASLVSVFLVISYMRLVVGNKFAFVHVGISQFVYLILFSYSFFFKGFTGLVITCLAIVSLFVAMQLTAKVNWQEVFQADKKETNF